MARATASPFAIIPNALLLLDPNDGDAEDQRMELERRAAQDIEAGLRDQLDAIMGDGPHGDSSPATPDELPARIARSNGRATDAMRRMLVDGADLGVSIVVDQLHGVGVGFNYRLANQLAADWAKAHAFELQKQLDATSQRQAGAILSDWIEKSGRFEAGEAGDLGALRDALSPWFGKARGERAASTEVTRALAQGSRLAYMQSGVVTEVEWLTSNDDDVCPICAPLNGKRGPLSSGIAVYGFPPAHTTCRCRIAGVASAVPGDA